MPAQAESAAPEKDPFGFGTNQGALDEAKRTGKISPETEAELERIQKRGQEASLPKKSMALGAKYPIIKQLSMTTYSYRACSERSIGMGKPWKLKRESRELGH